MSTYEERHSTAGIAAGLNDAQATIAEIWRRHDDNGMRERSKAALEAIIAANTRRTP